MRKYLIATLLSAAFSFPASLHAVESNERTVAGTYEILVCKESCSFSDQKNVVVKGQLILFANKLEKKDLNRFDGNRLAYHYGEAINGCFALDRIGKGNTYAGLSRIGVTEWTRQGDEFHFALGRSVDAGHVASVKQTPDGLLGTGHSWGTGVAAPKDYGPDIVTARRTGDADISKCVLHTAEEAETQKLLADPVRKRIFDMQFAYRKSLVAALKASDLPRDWALAALTDAHNFDAAAIVEHAALITRARAAASEDELIQWIAMHQSHSRYTSDGRDDSALLALLQRKEPDNAAVWIETLSAAVKASDAAAIDAALAHMAAATRYDEHGANFVRAQLDAYKRHPMPDEYFEIASPRIPLLNKETAPYYLGDSFGTGYAGRGESFPGLHELFVLCLQQPGARDNAYRVKQCAAIGKLLATRSTNVHARDAGSQLLSEMQVLTSEDVERARAQAWIGARYWEIYSAGFKQRSVKESIAHLSDWIDSGDEYEANVRSVEHAGKATNPPFDWKPNDMVSRSFERAKGSPPH